MPDDDDGEDELAAEDGDSALADVRHWDHLNSAERAQRLRRLWEIEGKAIGSSHSLPAGPYGVAAFYEARQAFVYGQYIATVCVAHLVIAQTLTGYFRGQERADLEGASFVGLAIEAEKDALISTAERRLLEQLNRRRNRYSHPARELAASARVFDREWREGPRQVYEDAELAIRCLLPLINRPPFTYPDDDD